MSDIFCRIIAGELDAEVVARTDDLIAFLDHRPVFKGHVLICPTAHVDTMIDLPQSLMEPLMIMAQRVAVAVQEGLGAQGSFVAVNNTVSQSVAHLHIHVVPRTKGDGLRGFFWPREKYVDDEVASYGQRLRDALDPEN